MLTAGSAATLKRKSAREMAVPLRRGWSWRREYIKKKIGAIESKSKTPQTWTVLCWTWGETLAT
jgi:hypothetical protein